MRNFNNAVLELQRAIEIDFAGDPSKVALELDEHCAKQLFLHIDFSRTATIVNNSEIRYNGLLIKVRRDG